MSDRARWLEYWCPTCRAAPRARCRLPWARRETARPSALDIARGPDAVSAVLLAAASGRTVNPEVNPAPSGAGDF